MESHEVDADVLIVARALGEMRNGVPPSSDTVEGPASPGLIDPKFRSYSQTASTPSLSVASSSSRSTISETATTDQEDDSSFVSRMSNFPLVTSAIRVYEQGKASSRVVKFGAEMMEGTVKTMTRPVMDRLPVNQLDEFACRQLDRFGRYGGKPEDSPPPQAESHSAPPSKNSPDPALSPRGRKHLWIDSDARVPSSRDSSVAPSSDTGWSPTSTRFHSESHWVTVAQAQNQSPSSGQEVQVINRSKWQAVLLEAGGIGAAVSEESMKRLKYCLQWLQYANSHIDQQILLLRSFIASISPNSLPSSSANDAIVPFQSLTILAQVKKELVDTIRQVVDVVYKYAGSALPEQARASVRSFILMLPERWALAARSEDPLPASYRTNQGMTGSAAMMAATRVLTLATESLDMMRSVSAVFKESLDRAEAWVDRLQQLGLQRQQQEQRPALPGPDWGNSSLYTVATMCDRAALANPFEAVPHHGGGSHHQSPPRHTTPSPSPSTRAASVVSDSGTDTETDDVKAFSTPGLRRRAKAPTSTLEDRRMDVDE
ncbi:hypothetical protein BS47DRAFT_1389502 [Hydnum rufescens UP504]|uniref:Opi1-domain-containing protein n=1 Tax=Hydnum rufescens UP504 TaxID=1448309 RepID=A0A9P6B6E6_9AGAM|nr:hypothetical protein BS47DRAFT_1389502 [Hydnum rufescens UP504]